MCYRVAADAERKAIEQRVASEKATAILQEKDSDQAELQAVRSESGLLAMFRWLFAPAGEETVISRQVDNTKTKAGDEKREVEQVR